MPLIMSKENKLPNLTDDAILFRHSAPEYRNRQEEGMHFLRSHLQISFPGSYVLPDRDGIKYVIFLDDIIRLGTERDLLHLSISMTLSGHTLIKLTKRRRARYR
ncbi:MAG: hypothetical protein MZV63_18790 [Marinilabiliales bacterium]|nr:hypothetical protein [Marinilabiliales bacterium]